MAICVQNASCMCEAMLRTHLDQKYISFPTPWNQVWGKQNSQVLPSSSCSSACSRFK